MLNKVTTISRIFQNLKFIPKRLFSGTKNQEANSPTFQEILQKNNPESLKLAQQILEGLEKEKKSQQAERTELLQKIGRFDKNHEDQLKKLQALKDNVANQVQEIELIKKRTKKEIDNCKDYSITKMAKEIIQVADNLKKCSILTEKHYKNNKDAFALGLINCNRVLVETLAKFDIAEFDPTNEIYNPNTQQSMVEIPDPSKVNNTVAMATMTGYTIKDRLLRSAKVCVYRN